ncbi:MAG TPA: hypothetical protein VGN14_02430 [Candidatus Elarobacter sp.]|jgi:pilus assembly protein Flp/PilA
MLALVLDESGQGLAEYGLVLTFIAVLCVGALTLISNHVSGLLNTVGSSI